MIYAKPSNKLFILHDNSEIKKISESKNIKAIRKAIESITVQEETGTYTFNFTNNKR